MVERLGFYCFWAQNIPQLGRPGLVHQRGHQALREAVGPGGTFARLPLGCFLGVLGFGLQGLLGLLWVFWVGHRRVPMRVPLGSYKSAGRCSFGGTVRVSDRLRELGPSALRPASQPEKGTLVNRQTAFFSCAI